MRPMRPHWCQASIIWGCRMILNGAYSSNFRVQKVGGHRKGCETRSVQCMQWKECGPFLWPGVLSLFKVQDSLVGLFLIKLSTKLMCPSRTETVSFLAAEVLFQYIRFAFIKRKLHSKTISSCFVNFLKYNAVNLKSRLKYLGGRRWWSKRQSKI